MGKNDFRLTQFRLDFKDPVRNEICPIFPSGDGSVWSNFSNAKTPNRFVQQYVNINLTFRIQQIKFTNTRPRKYET